ncbi:MAG: 3-hydroxyacyl-CoA dehydrogenase NAD-binding domain-containing protein [bacterium]
MQIDHQGGVAVVTLDESSVEAQHLVELVSRLDADTAVMAVVLVGMTVGDGDLATDEPSLEPAIAALSAARKPWVAAVHGGASGIGLQLILGCGYRLAGPTARFDLPEVGLGVIPGAGGTQRLPRIIGVEAAIGVVAENVTLGAARAAELGLVTLVTGDLLTEAVAFAERVAAQPLPVARALEPIDLGVWQAAEARIAAKSKGMAAPLLALGAVRLGVEQGLDAGLAHERATYLRLNGRQEAAALRYLVRAERAALHPADLRAVVPRRFRSAAVIGGGTMGSGIVAALRNAGLPVVMVERDTDSLARGMQTLAGMFAAAERRGLLTSEAAAERLTGVTPLVGYAGLGDCDLVIEAVFEDLAVKQAVFGELAKVCRADAILATNTSYLDPSQIAAGLPGPERFIGLHFFSPAQVMKLMEIVPVPETAPDVLAAGFALAGELGKISVRSGICDGFIGNRILRRYRGEAEAMLAEGVGYAEIDAAMRGFGYAMGPFEMQDLAGLDISYMTRQAARARGEVVPETPGDLLVRAGRKGQKTGGGWYDYAPGERKARPSAEAARLIAPLVGAQVGLAADQITARLISAMAAEGRAILAEGIAENAAAIDLVEVHGYGFPRRLGGPMFMTARQTQVKGPD